MKIFVELLDCLHGSSCRRWSMKALKEVRMGESGVTYLETRKDDFLVTGYSGCGGPRDRFVFDLS